MHPMTLFIRRSFMSPFDKGILAAMLLFELAGLPGRALGQETASATPPDTGLSVPAVPPDPGFARIMVVARASSDSVVLRWAPTTPHAWRLGNRIGYIVEKIVNGGSPARVTPDTIRPWPIRRFVDALNADTGDSYFGLALYSLSADTSLFGMADSLGLDTLGTRAVLNTTLFGYALLAADNKPAVAEALGLRLVDKSGKTGTRITYRVRLSSSRDYRIDPGEVQVTVGTPVEGKPPANLSASGMDRRIVLSWRPEAQGAYSGYFIFRSGDGGKTFKLLNRKPLVIVTPADARMRSNATYADTAIDNYVVYHYRVRGVDAFGEMGRGADVEASGRDMTPPPRPFISNPEQLGRDSIRLRWEMPLSAPDLAGFVVSRSINPDSGFHRISAANLPPSVREYVDGKPVEGEPYYAVGALDTAGNVAVSLPVYAFRVDTMPPPVPTGLRGTIDTNGVVRLHWHRIAEKKILGYRVLRANAPDHEFQQLTGEVWKDTAFTDTVSLQTLTSHVYYRIAAVDRRFNPSPMSSPLTLRRPDIIAPAAPMFTDVTVTDSSASLQWVPSSSDDVRALLLFRRMQRASQWSLLATLPAKVGSYTDKAVRENTMYEYTLEAVDSAGLHSRQASPVQARPYDAGVRPMVYNLHAEYQKKERRILVSWAYAPIKQEKLYFLVFRSAAGNPLAPYRSVPSSQTNLFDDGLLGNGRYTYAVKVMTANGAESPLSGRVEVTVSER